MPNGAESILKDALLPEGTPWGLGPTTVNPEHAELMWIMPRTNMRHN